MPNRHHTVAMSLLGLCLGTSTACGGRDWTAGVWIPADLVRNASPGQSTGPTASPGSASPTPGRSTGAAPVPNGFKPIGGPANGVSVAVPKEWVTIDLTKDDLNKGLKSSGLSGPTLEQAKKSLQTLVDNKGIWAADPESAKTSPNGFPTNLNGFCQAGRQISTEQLIKETRSQLEQLKAKVVAAGKVTIGSREAARIVYTFPTNGVDVKGAQYYVPTENKTCIITLSTDADGKQELFDRIAQTIRPV
ncbi:hypothetical protein ABZ260_30695 [Streptosporangium sp. NPDC006013]|uniref:hypothetical protein n=1 Tax=Streptosporangium sp. NPDC006013 TaxID=3155596 RepID=UPI0033A26863